MSHFENGLVGGILIGFLIGAALTAFLFTETSRQDLIDRGYAQYCPDDGHFAWVGECDK